MGNTCDRLLAWESVCQIPAAEAEFVFAIPACVGFVITEAGAGGHHHGGFPRRLFLFVAENGHGKRVQRTPRHTARPLWRAGPDRGSFL